MKFRALWRSWWTLAKCTNARFWRFPMFQKKMRCAYFCYSIQCKCHQKPMLLWKDRLLVLNFAKSLCFQLSLWMRLLVHHLWTRSADWHSLWTSQYDSGDWGASLASTFLWREALSWRRPAEARCQSKPLKKLRSAGAFLKEECQSNSIR